MDYVTRTKRAYRKLSHFGELIRKEREGLRKAPVPLSTRLSMWRRGFLGESAPLYDFSDGGADLYLSDWNYYLKTTFVNYGRYNPLLNDKVFFYHAMKSMAAPTPTVFGFVNRGGIAWTDAPPGVDGANGVRTLLEQGRELVIKPDSGGGGYRISFVSLEGGAVMVNAEERDMAFVERLLLPGTLVCERLHQAAYAARIHPATVNTLRIVTLWDHERGEPFLGWVVHRFGTQRSVPVDNFGQGGLSADVDHETGELSRAVSFPYSGRLEWHTVHPDTGAQIEGTVVTRWPAVRDGILDVARRLPQLEQIGWDVLVTEGGFSIIEGNSYPNPRTIQVHRPLLADPRVRAFYRHHGIVGA